MATCALRFMRDETFLLTQKYSYFVVWETALLATVRTAIELRDIDAMRDALEEYSRFVQAMVDATSHEPSGRSYTTPTPIDKLQELLSCVSLNVDALTTIDAVFPLIDMKDLLRICLSNRMDHGVVDVVLERASTVDVVARVLGTCPALEDETVAQILAKFPDAIVDACVLAIEHDPHDSTRVTQLVRHVDDEGIARIQRTVAKTDTEATRALARERESRGQQPEQNKTASISEEDG
jgi:hypothetical protein